MTADFAINSTIETQFLCKCFITVDVLGISDIKKDKKNVQLESRSCLFKINCGVLVISNTTLDHSKCKNRCGSMFTLFYFITSIVTVMLFFLLIFKGECLHLAVFSLYVVIGICTSDFSAFTGDKSFCTKFDYNYKRNTWLASRKE